MWIAEFGLRIEDSTALINPQSAIGTPARLQQAVLTYLAARVCAVLKKIFCKRPSSRTFNPQKATAPRG